MVMAETVTERFSGDV